MWSSFPGSFPLSHSARLGFRMGLLLFPLIFDLLHACASLAVGNDPRGQPWAWLGHDSYTVGLSECSKYHRSISPSRHSLLFSPTVFCLLQVSCMQCKELPSSTAGHLWTETRPLSSTPAHGVGLSANLDRTYYLGLVSWICRLGFTSRGIV